MTTADPPAAPPPGATTKTSPLSVAGTVTRLTELIAGKGMKLFAVIDQRAEASSAGLELRETTLVIFGSPAAGTPVMDAVPLAALDLPLKVLIWADGGSTRVSYYGPAALATRYGLTEDLAARFAGIDALTDAVTAGESRGHDMTTSPSPGGPAMLVDAMAPISVTPLTAGPLDTEAAAVQAEADGYDAFGVPETQHDAFTCLALAARATSRITVQSAIAVAFARNPMNLAVLANDIQHISAGRFQLGLGSQVRQHIERRYSMPWSHPAARMEEFISAVRAIWASWASGDRLAFRGTYYQHTLMTGFFSPGPNPYGNPPVYLAAVGELMTAVAGRVADGILCHGFTTETYLRERTIPALTAARGSLDGFAVCLPVFAVMGADEAARAAAATGVRQQIAFYGSTPAYRPVLDLHGWGELHEQLNLLSRRQEWVRMGELITDDVLAAFAVSGTPAEVAAAIRERYGDVVTRVSLYTPYEADPADVRAVTGALRAAP